MTKHTVRRLLLLLIFVSRLASANWLYLAVQQPFAFSTYSLRSVNRDYASRLCNSLSYLTEYQKRICALHPSAMYSVGLGARRAISECQWQFRQERWNCTPARTRNESITDIFATLLRWGSRESAFVEAMTTAGLVHSVVTACTAGNVSDCSCDMSKHGTDGQSEVPEKWRWGGCSDNIRYGLIFSREFLDRWLKKLWQTNRQANHLVTLHNQEVGRRTIADNMRRHCRCHGVSGSCEFKTCWLQMPKLSDVGELLKTYYDRSSVQVTKKAKRRLRRKNRYERKIPIRFSELVFQNKSPNYCVRDERIGTLGTNGRQCNRSSLGPDSCDLLCCGRGYDTRIMLKHERCHCKFVWCCYVTCKTCAWNVELQICK